MLSHVLLLKPQNTTTLLFSKHSTGSKYLSKLNAKSYHSHTSHFNPHSHPTYDSCSPLNHLNQFLFHSNTTPPSCHLVTQIFQSLHSHGCPASLDQTLGSIATN